MESFGFFKSTKLKMANVLLGHVILFTSAFVICQCIYIPTSENVAVEEGKSVTLLCEISRRVGRNRAIWEYSNGYSAPLQIYSMDERKYFCRWSCNLNTTGNNQFDLFITTATYRHPGTYRCLSKNIYYPGLIRQYELTVN